MHVKQQWVNWTYLEKHLQMAPMVEMFRVMGWRRAICLKQNWNEAVIRQFYATLEVRMDKERLFWMTGTMLHSFQCPALAVANVAELVRLPTLQQP
jgi:hypothetical protein